MALPLVLAFSLISATSWRAPWPRIWTSEDGSFALAVTPGRMQANEVKPTLLRLFSHDWTGKELTLWRSDIDFYPYRVLISSDAHVVLLNEYPGYSDRTALAILSDQGQVLARYPRSAFLSKAEVDAIPGNEGLMPKAWFKVAFFDSVRNLTNPPNVTQQLVDRAVGELKGIHNEFPLALRVETVTGKTLWFDLMTGKQAG